MWKSFNKSIADAKSTKNICADYFTKNELTKKIELRRKLEEARRPNPRNDTDTFRREGFNSPEVEEFLQYEKKAHRGDIQAQIISANCYRSGRGTPENPQKALEWYLKAANKGNATAQYRVGWCLENGYGTPQDLNNAFGWYQLSAEQGNNVAKEALNALINANSEATPEAKKGDDNWLGGCIAIVAIIIITWWINN